MKKIPLFVIPAIFIAFMTFIGAKHDIYKLIYNGHEYF